ncbi:MBL fold metallo-hydrolase [bacterium]|nr:MBL fold metallo-hydrolase [bacterium]MCI0604141.1 MBL fold metallo-hydrolase [bacterium]
MKISFYGAAQTVTGSRFLIETPEKKVLVDCGLFQGPRIWKERNWAKLPFEPAGLDCVVLTHAHIDHAGFLPRFAKLGFRGPVICTPATADLLSLLLPDSGHIQEEDAAFANKKKYTRHDPALPLYTEEDAKKVLEQLQQLEYYKPVQLSSNLSFSFLRAGHILGSAMIEFRYRDKTILFTGDLGRPSQFLIKRPDEVRSADYLVMESTYGNRLHQRVDVKKKLTELIKRTFANGGSVLVPAFAIGRTQELLFLLRNLVENGQIPKLPIFVDSPMAIDAMSIYNHHRSDSSKELEHLQLRDDTPFQWDGVRPLRTVQDSMSLNTRTQPCIIISASGMASAGRILHHLKRRISEHFNTVLFIGFQAEGTKGRLLVDGIKEIKVHGKQYPVEAKIEYLDALSCHADYEEILQWLQNFQRPPEKVFLVHGETSASQSLSQKIAESYGWNVHVPVYMESVDL